MYDHYPEEKHQSDEWGLEKCSLRPIEDSRQHVLDRIERIVETKYAYQQNHHPFLNYSQIFPLKNFDLNPSQSLNTYLPVETDRAEQSCNDIDVLVNWEDCKRSIVLHMYWEGHPHLELGLVKRNAERAYILALCYQDFCLALAFALIA